MLVVQQARVGEVNARPSRAAETFRGWRGCAGRAASLSARQRRAGRSSPVGIGTDASHAAPAALSRDAPRSRWFQLSRPTIAAVRARTGSGTAAVCRVRRSLSLLHRGPWEPYERSRQSNDSRRLALTRPLALQIAWTTSRAMGAEKESAPAQSDAQERPSTDRTTSSTKAAPEQLSALSAKQSEVRLSCKSWASWHCRTNPGPLDA